jgi:hypothetical protein
MRSRLDENADPQGDGAGQGLAGASRNNRGARRRKSKCRDQKELIIIASCLELTDFRKVLKIQTRTSS